MDLLIAGSLAYDTIESESGRADEVLGGSAVYAGISARFHLDSARIGLLGVVLGSVKLYRLLKWH